MLLVRTAACQDNAPLKLNAEHSKKEMGDSNVGEGRAVVVCTECLAYWVLSVSRGESGDRASNQNTMLGIAVWSRVLFLKFK